MEKICADKFCVDVRGKIRKMLRVYILRFVFAALFLLLCFFSTKTYIYIMQCVTAVLLCGSK
jgi:hypothetical protein